MAISDTNASQTPPPPLEPHWRCADCGYDRKDLGQVPYPECGSRRVVPAYQRPTKGVAVRAACALGLVIGTGFALNAVGLLNDPFSRGVIGILIVEGLGLLFIVLSAIDTTVWSVNRHRPITPSTSFGDVYWIIMMASILLVLLTVCVRLATR